MTGQDAKIFFTVWLVIASLADPRPDGVQNRYLALARALAEDRSPRLDRFAGLDLADVDVRPDGHRYTRAFPGLPIVVTPLVPIARAVHRIFGVEEADAGGFGMLGVLVVLFVTAPAAAGAAVLLARLLRDLGVPPPTAALAGLALPLSTHLLFYAARVSENALIVLGAAAAAAALEARRRPGAPRPHALAGAALGLLAPVSPFGAAITAVPLAFLLRPGVRRRPWGALLAAAAPGLAILALYQWAVFGAPWRVGFHTGERGYQAVFAAHVAAGDLADALAREAPVALKHLTWGSRGIWLYAPVTILSTIALAVGLARRTEAGAWCRAAAAATAANLGATLLFLDGLWSGLAAWGPRHLVPALPWLILAIPLGLCPPPRTLGAFAAWGFVLNWAGAQWGYAIVPWPAFGRLLTEGPLLPAARLLPPEAAPAVSVAATAVLVLALASLWCPRQTPAVG